MSQPVDDAAYSISKVAESAVALAKAELKLATTEGKAWLSSIAVGVALGCVGLLLIPVVVLLVALSPLLLAYQPWHVVLLSVGLAVAPMLASLLFARSALHRAQSSPSRGRSSSMTDSRELNARARN